jgi:hypothetical protein
MDPLALIVMPLIIWLNSLSCVDPNGDVRRCFEVLKGNNASLLHPYDILYSCIVGGNINYDDFKFIATLSTVI